MLYSLFGFILRNNMNTATEDFDRSSDNMTGLIDNMSGVTDNLTGMMTINSTMSDNFANMQPLLAFQMPSKSGCAGVIDARLQALQ